jgi:hypothetical protein
VIAILADLLLPVLSKAKWAARNTVFKNNVSGGNRGRWNRGLLAALRIDDQRRSLRGLHDRNRAPSDQVTRRLQEIDASRGSVRQELDGSIRVG